MKKQVGSTKGDSEGTIDSLIAYMESAKLKGATHYSMDWSGDPQWAFKWFYTYYVMTPEQVKQEKIAELQAKIDDLKKS